MNVPTRPPMRLGRVLPSTSARRRGCKCIGRQTVYQRRGADGGTGCMAANLGASGVPGLWHPERFGFATPPVAPYDADWVCRGWAKGYFVDLNCP